MVTPAAKRKAVASPEGRLFGMSERRACKAIGCCRMTVPYETSRPDDREVRERMKAIAQERRRFGYRRLLVMLRREGLVDEPQEAVPALSGGEARRSPPWRPRRRPTAFFNNPRITLIGRVGSGWSSFMTLD